MAQPTPTEQRALFAQAFKKRMSNLADVGDRVATEVPEMVEGAKFAPFDLVGAPVDLTTMAMRGVGIPVPEKPFGGSAYLIDKYADLGEAIGVDYRRPTDTVPEMIGRVAGGFGMDFGMAGLAGLFAKATKTRGSGIEKKGSGNAELDSSPSDLEPLPSEKFGNFTTPELITAWTIDQTKVPRAEVAARLKNDPSATARTNEALDDLGYGDTVPVYRYIMLKGDKESAEFVPEDLISATLDPRQLKSNIFFMDKTNPVFTDTVQRLVRYDVPRDRIAGYLPAFSDQIKRGVNKAVKERGVGQDKLGGGTKVVTNPAEHSKTLLKLQDEVIADVSDLEPKFLSSPSYDPRGVVPLELRDSIAKNALKLASEGKIDMSQFSERNTALNPSDFGGPFFSTKDQVEAFKSAEAAARQKFVDEYSEFFNFTNLEPSPKSTTTVAPKKEVLEGEVVGGKSDKYTKLQKQADEARTSELSDAKTLQMEIQGVTDAFDVAAAKKLDATFEMIGRQMGEDAPYTSKDFTDNVIDEFEGAIDQGMSRADALIDAVRVTTDNYNRTFNADLFNTEDILSDLSKGINEDFGFDAALDARRAGQANRAALEQQLKKAESVTRRADAAASQAELERLAGVTDDMTPDEVFQAISSYVGKDQAGISGAGIPQPKRPQLRVISDNTPVKKAAGGKVDLRSGIGNVFKLYS